MGETETILKPETKTEKADNNHAGPWLATLALEPRGMIVARAHAMRAPPILPTPRASAVTTLFAGFWIAAPSADTITGRRSCHRYAVQRKLCRVGPNCETWPNTLTENSY
jgi:hypothetical protein